MGKTKKNVGLVAMAIISYFFFVAFIVTAILAGIFNLNGIIDSFMFKDLLKGVVSAAAAVIALAGLIIAIIVAAKKKRGVVVLGAFAILLAGVAVIIEIQDVGNVGTYIDSFASNIVPVATLSCAILTAVLGIATWIMSLCVKSNASEQLITVEDNFDDQIEIENEEQGEEVAPEYQPEPEPEADPLTNKEALASLIREVVRDIIKDEMSHQQEQSVQHITGATFSGPLVVQYFNGTVPASQPVAQTVAPVEQPAPVEEPAPIEEAPVEEVKEEVAPAETVEEPAPVEQPAPVAEQPAPVEEGEEKAKIVRVPFQTRMIEAEDEMKANYNELKNEILSWGVKSRVSNSGDTFRLHRKTYIKLTIAGKSLKLYFALNPKDYADSTIPVQDASDKNIYVEIPLIFKVKSGLSMRRAKQLIQDVMEKDGLEQGEVGSVDWVKEIEVEFKDGVTSSDDEDIDDEE